MLQAPEDNLYPRTGAHLLAEPEEQRQERDQEATQTMVALPVLQEILDYFDEQIAHYGDVDAIPINLEQKPSIHQKLVAVNKLMKAELKVQRDHIEELIKAHTQ